MKALPQSVTAKRYRRLCANGHFALTVAESVSAVTAAPYRGAVTLTLKRPSRDRYRKVTSPDGKIPTLPANRRRPSARPSLTADGRPWQYPLF